MSARWEFFLIFIRVEKRAFVRHYYRIAAPKIIRTNMWANDVFWLFPTSTHTENSLVVTTTIFSTFFLSLSFKLSPLSLMYYEFAPVAPAEALSEQFHSIAGFVWNNRRYNMDSHNVSCVTMKHLLWKVQQKYTDSDEEWYTCVR